MENNVLGQDAYYGFSTNGASTLTIHISETPYPGGILFLNEIPEASIRLDGNDSDWVGIDALITYDEDDSVCADTNRDIKAGAIYTD